MTASVTTLVLGGARSGKSSFAESLTNGSGLEKVYVATATSGDSEMETRILAHRSRRGHEWTTIEEPLALVDTLAKEVTKERSVLVDCLTLWLSNLMFSDRDLEAESHRLAHFIETAKGPIVFVTNEIGLGLVPETSLGRSFRDAQGRLNQIVAAAVAQVAFVAAGLPLWLKRPFPGE